MTFFLTKHKVVFQKGVDNFLDFLSRVIYYLNFFGWDKVFYVKELKYIIIQVDDRDCILADYEHMILRE